MAQGSGAILVAESRGNCHAGFR